MRVFSHPSHKTYCSGNAKNPEHGSKNTVELNRFSPILFRQSKPHRNRPTYMSTHKINVLNDPFCLVVINFLSLPYSILFASLTLPLTVLCLYCVSGTSIIVPISIASKVSINTLRVTSRFLILLSKCSGIKTAFILSSMYQINRNNSTIVTQDHKNSKLNPFLYMSTYSIIKVVGNETLYTRYISVHVLRGFQ